jgi:hypothetical protein
VCALRALNSVPFISVFVPQTFSRISLNITPSLFGSIVGSVPEHIGEDGRALVGKGGSDHGAAAVVMLWASECQGGEVNARFVLFTLDGICWMCVLLRYWTW